MKRLFNYWIVIATAIAITGCDTKDYDVIDEFALTLSSPQKGITITLNSSSLSLQGDENVSPWHTNINTSVSYTYDLSKWEEESEQIRNKMEAVYNPIRKQNPNHHLQCHYVYNSIVDINITANKPICGRAAGEELSDLFMLYIYGLVFTFPNANFVEFDKSPIVFEIDDWTKGGYITPKYFFIVPKESICAEELAPDVVFSVLCDFGHGVECIDTFNLPQ